MALGYLTGKAASKLLNVKVNIPLLFAASIIPDTDILIPALQHRGPTHSLIVMSLIFFPLLMIYRKRAVPYFTAMIQHSILGDYLTGGTQLLWPATINRYGIGIEITSLANIFTEWIFFLASLTVMLQTKDAWKLLQHHTSNLLLAIPIFTVLLPTLLSFPLSVPLELVIPHFIYLAIFSSAIIIDLKTELKQELAKLSPLLKFR